MRSIPPGVRRYLFAVVAALSALFLRKLLSPWLGLDNPYQTAWAAIMFSAWYCGIGPSVVCTLISLLGIWYWFLPYDQSWIFQNPRTEISGMFVFLLLASLIIALGDSNRKSRVRSELEVAERKRVDDELWKAQVQLASRVQERTAELHRTSEQLSQEAARVRAQAEWLDAANDAIFVGDSDERITYWNKGAERLYGWTSAEALGKSAHELLRTCFPIPFGEIATRCHLEGWEGELVHTKRDGTELTVASRWTSLKDANNNVAGWLEINRDITDRKAAEAARQLNAELLRMQDEERRKIARELHDNASQMVIALMLKLGEVRACGNLRAEEMRLVSEADAFLQTLNRELFATSSLLHPTLLDDVGLWTTLEWYVDGFSKRNGIAAIFERDSDLGRLGSDLEVAIFRVVQESLTNVHRHSSSLEASVRLLRSSGEVRLEIRDRGKGLPGEKQLINNSSDGTTGVGFRGMRERVSQLGGNLSIESSSAGTTVIAIFPIPKSSGDSGDALAVA
jgi:PAS domain S-box-containing protein